MVKGKKAKKAYKRKILINLSILIIILGIVAGIGLKSSYFLIQNVEVKNNKIVTKEEVEVLSKLKGKNIFLLSKESIINNIKTNPYIESVEIKRNFPSKVSVKINEKKIGAFIKLNEGYVNVDNDGKMVQIVSEPLEGKVPELKSIPVNKYTPNQYVYNKVEQQEALKACLKLLDIDECHGVFSALDVSDPYNIKLISSTGSEFNVGSKVNLDYKISYAISILNYDEVKNQKGYIKVLDDGTATFKKY